jgi:hypothetical protein
MNQKNLDYLKEGLKYLGFGEGLYDKLTENIKQQKDHFQLKTVNEYGPHKVNYSLDFKKGDQSDMYFFNKYTASFKASETSEEKIQAFYPKKNTGVTAKEAYNLLNGRAVNKDLTNQEGQPYNAWLQLDWSQKDDHGNHKFKMIHQAYGYDLAKELEKHPIKELSDPVTKERLMQSLERGNLHQVTFKKGDREDKMFIEANPQFKTLNVYDDKLKKVFIEVSNKYHVPGNDPMQNQSEQQKEREAPQKKQDIKKETGHEPDDDSPKKGKRSKIKIGG